MGLLGGTNEGTATQKLIFGILGVVIILGTWVLLTNGVNPVLMQVPSPWKVLSSFAELLNENELLKNVGFSLGENISGYLVAILLVLPIGFVIGLVRYARWAFQKPVDSLRYIPLTALTGLFVLWFGIWTPMKVNFLAFGILIYLLPVMVQRIDEVSDVYLKTVHTLGATDWQVLKTVYFPSVLSRLFDDIRVLTAISWTYIIVAEGFNSNQGGIGTLIYYAGQRQGRYDKVFALLIIIMIIGILQDRVFLWLDKEFFPFKYQAREAVKSSAIQRKGITSVIFDYVLSVVIWIGLGIYIILFLNEYLNFFGSIKPLDYFFGSTTWVINLIVFSLLVYKAWKWFNNRNDLVALQAATSKKARG
jgi:NitT/TauT family transport system permease protein